ncbi:MAG: putative basic amino acid antiporter YfcC [Thermaurantiacus sp.]
MRTPETEPADAATRPGITVPDTLVIFVVLALLAWGATFLFAPGQFAVADGRLVPGSFASTGAPDPAPLFGASQRVGFLDIPFEGLVSGSRSSAAIGLAAFLLVIGGTFGVIMRSGTIDRALVASLRQAGGRGDGVILGLFVAFSLAGAIFGMAEEAIALSLILVPALRRAGYDSLTGLLVCFGATQVGFATSWMNPFNVIIAQGIAGLPPLSGLEFRLAMWTVFTGVAATWVTLYARRVRRDPERSLAFAADQRLAARDTTAGTGRMHLADWLVLGLILAALAWVGWGVVAKGWYLAELAAQFLALGLAVALVATVFRMVPAADLGAAFRDGAAQMAPVILIIGIVKGIMLLIGGESPDAPSLLNSLLHFLSGMVAGLPEWLTAGAMLAVQSVLNLLIPSGSGQAAITMPIMAPLADLAGVSRQVAVLAFQLGDGFTNLLAPTSAVLLGCLAAARVELGLWLRFAWKPTAALIGLAFVTVLVAHGTGLT